MEPPASIDYKNPSHQPPRVRNPPKTPSISPSKITTVSPKKITTVSTSISPKKKITTVSTSRSPSPSKSPKKPSRSPKKPSKSPKKPSRSPKKTTTISRSAQKTSPSRSPFPSKSPKKPSRSPSQSRSPKKITTVSTSISPKKTTTSLSTSSTTTKPFYVKFSELQRITNIEPSIQKIQSSNIQIEDLNLPLMQSLYRFYVPKTQRVASIDSLVFYPKLVLYSLMPKKLYKNDFLNLSKSEYNYYHSKLNRMKEDIGEIKRFVFKYLQKYFSDEKLKSMNKDNIKELIKETADQKLKVMLKLWVNQKDTSITKKIDTRPTMEDYKEFYNQLFANSELIGDVILTEVIMELIKKIRKSEKEYQDSKYDACFNKLENLLQTNFFFKEIMDKIDFKVEDYLDYFPVQKLPIRSLKRTNQKRREIEIYDSGCTDYKYTANLYEQLIFLFSLILGKDQIDQIFVRHLQLIKFDIYKYIDQCAKNELYTDIKFKTGCSCLDKFTNTRVCDNPPAFHTEKKKLFNMETLPCPKECDTESLVDQILESIISQEDTIEGKQEVLDILLSTN
jgi:hypothetical protein